MLRFPQGVTSRQSVSSRLSLLRQEATTDPATLVKGFEAQRALLENKRWPLRERLTAVEAMLADQRAQLERLLDLYIAGEFPREMLTQRRERLEKRIAELETEQAKLADELDARAFSDSGIRTMEEFAREVAKGLSLADADFQTPRSVAEALDLQGTLAVEEGDKVLYLRCLSGIQPLSVDKDTPGSINDNLQGTIYLTTRIVLGTGRQDTHTGQDGDCLCWTCRVGSRRWN